MNRARALRLVVACAGLAAAGLLASSALATGSRSQAGNLSPLSRQVLAAVNQLRVAHGLVPLRESSALDRAARQHSVEMGQRGYFSHSSADGSSSSKRIAKYYSAKGHAHWAVGENILWGSPSVSAAAAMKLWSGDPGHRRNMLAPKWREIGVSAVQVAHAPGFFHGLPVTIITTDFGVRS